MKPKEDSSDADIIELFCKLGTLVVEGRLPESSDRGRVEGPHCSQRDHICSSQNHLCVHAAECRQEFKSLCLQNEPIVIDVLIQDHDSEENVLLERWKVEFVQHLVNSFHVDESLLLQAVRSHLHFSQLSAWLSQSQGEFPKHVTHRILTKDEVPLHSFPCQPDSHVFPMSVVDVEKIVKVSLFSLPRDCPITQSIYPHSNLKASHCREKLNSSGPSQFEKEYPVVRDLFLSKSTAAEGFIQEVCLLQDLQVEDNIDVSHVHCVNPGKSPMKKKQCRSLLTEGADRKKIIGDMKEQSWSCFYDSKTSLEGEGVQGFSGMDPCLPHHQRPDKTNSNKRSLSLVKGKLCSSEGDCGTQPRPVPKELSKDFRPKAVHRIQRSLTCNDAVAIFQPPEGLPFSSSPAPLRRSMTELSERCEKSPRSQSKYFCELGPEELNKSLMWLSKSAPAAASIPRLRVNFEESVLNRCMDPLGNVEGFRAELGASGSFCPQHVTLPVEAQFFQISDDNAPSPYVGYINLTKGLEKKGYHIPKKGTIQLTLFNPYGTVVKVFVTLYNFTDMPSHSQTFLRQRILSDPPLKSQDDEEQTFLHYLMHLRFATSRSGKLYLHTDIRLIFPRQPPDIPATQLRVMTHGPTNPKYTLRKVAGRLRHRVALETAADISTTV